MDDPVEKLDRLLSSPDGMKRIEELMAAFGAGAPSDEPPAASPPVPELSSLMPQGDMGMLLKLLPLLSQMGHEDDSTALLHALRPHLTSDRQKRLDDAGQLLKMIRLLPLLGELKKGDDTR